MPTAKNMPTTTSRRALLGASAALLVAGGFKATAAKADELDSDIIAASRNYLALEDDLSRLSKLEGGLPDARQAALLAEMDVIHDQQAALRSIMATNPARTPEGLRAKAAALQSWLPSNPAGTLPCCDEDALAWSLCDDLLGRA